MSENDNPKADKRDVIRPILEKVYCRYSTDISCGDGEECDNCRTVIRQARNELAKVIKQVMVETCNRLESSEECDGYCELCPLISFESDLDYLLKGG